VEEFNRIRIVLAEQGKKSAWLAEALEVSKGTVSRWVWNKSQPNIATLYAIARVLEVEVAELLVTIEQLDRH